MTVLFDVGGLCVVGQTHFDTTQRRNLLTCRIKTREITDFFVHFPSATGLRVRL